MLSADLQANKVNALWAEKALIFAVFVDRSQRGQNNMDHSIHICNISIVIDVYGTMYIIKVDDIVY